MESIIKNEQSDLPDKNVQEKAIHSGRYVRFPKETDYSQFLFYFILYLYCNYMSLGRE